MKALSYVQVVPREPPLWKHSALKYNIPWNEEVPINDNLEENIVTVNIQEGQDNFNKLI